MSEQLEVRLREGPYTVGRATGEIAEMRQAADTLKRYREAFSAIIEAIENSDDAEAIAIAREQIR